MLRRSRKNPSHDSDGDDDLLTIARCTRSFGEVYIYITSPFYFSARALFASRSLNSLLRLLHGHPENQWIFIAPTSFRNHWHFRYGGRQFDSAIANETGLWRRDRLNSYLSFGLWWSDLLVRSIMMRFVESFRINARIASTRFIETLLKLLAVVGETASVVFEWTVFLCTKHNMDSVKIESVSETCRKDVCVYMRVL